jgi:hypothetical protein
LDFFARFLAIYTIRTKDIEIAKSANFDATNKLITRKIKRKDFRRKLIKGSTNNKNTLKRTA